MAIDKKVIDISQYNTVSNYVNVVNNTDGCIVRLGYRGYGTSGTLVTDQNFAQHITQLSNAVVTAGKQSTYAIGLYWTTQAISTAEAEAEANYIVQMINRYASGVSIDFPIYIDSDFGDPINRSGRADNITISERTNYLLDLTIKIRDYGYKAGVCATENWYNTYLNLNRLVSSGIDSFWISYSPNQPSSTIKNKMGDKYHAWQYSTAESISGINACNCSHFYKWWKGDEPVPVQIDISTKSASLAYTTTVFNGTAKTPNMLFTDVPTTGYTVSYSNNVNVGTAAATATGKAPNYKGTKSLNFTITKPYINTSRFEVSLDITDYTYDGTAKTPTAHIIDKERQSGSSYYELIQGTDYTVSYTNNINAGNATATITGKGNYQGTVNSIFYIAPDNINKYSIQGCADYYKYTSTRILPDVYINGLTKNVDYVVTYGTNINIGQGSVTCTGQGNFVGSITKYFIIASFEISHTTVNVLENPIYDGREKTPSIEVIDTELSEILIKGQDYTVSYSNNINASNNAKVTVTGIGRYSGTQNKSFTIRPYSITNFNIWIDKDIYSYNSKEICPDIMVESLNRYTDFNLLYADNINIGKGKVTVMGINNYCDDVTIQFDIIAQDIQKCIAKLGYPSFYTRYRVIDDNNYPFRIYTPDEIIIIPGQEPIDNRYRLQPTIDYEIEKANRERMDGSFYLYYYKVKGLNGFTGTAEFRFRMISANEVPTPTAAQLADDGEYQFGCVGGTDTSGSIIPIVPETAEGNWDWGVDGDVSDHDNHDTHTIAENIDEYNANNPNVWILAYSPSDGYQLGGE